MVTIDNKGGMGWTIRLENPHQHRAFCWRVVPGHPDGGLWMLSLATFFDERRVAELVAARIPPEATAMASRRVLQPGWGEIDREPGE